MTEVFITSERHAHAMGAGQSVSEQDILSPNGFKTGEVRRRLVSPIELLWSRKSLDGAQVSACGRWSELHYKLQSSMGGTSSAYQPKMDGGSAILRPIERRVHIAGQVVKIKACIPRQLWGVLDWIATSGELGLSTDDLARTYYPGDSKAVRVAKIVALIGLTATMLSDHFEGR